MLRCYSDYVALSITLRSALIGSALVGATLLAQASFAAGNTASGKDKSVTCQACHGATGNETLNGSYPRLAGQYENYLEHALKAYRSGERSNAIMAGFAAALSDQDIADLAAYFASQGSSLQIIPKQ